MTPLDSAIVLATYAHLGQVDNGGTAYILHPLRVMLRMASDEDRIVAVLHDVLEDNPAYSVEDIERQFGERAALAVDVLTRREGEPYDTYIERCCTDPIAWRVKLADLEDNLDPTRIPLHEQGKYRKMWQRYERAYTYLMGQY